MGLLGRLFRTPSDFPRDPWGFARNQAMHSLGAAAIAWWALSGGPLAYSATVATCLALYAWWERAQYRRHDAIPWDCVEDWAFVAAGLCLPAFPLIALPMAGHLLAGALRRDARRQEAIDRQWRTSDLVDRARRNEGATV